MYRIVLSTLAAVVLVIGRPGPEVLAAVADPGTFVRSAGVDGAAIVLVSVALWLLALRIALSGLLMCAAWVPGRVGRAGRRAAVVLSPRFLRPVLVGTVGLGALCGSATAIAAVPYPARVPAATLAAPAVPSLGWPTDPAGGSRAAAAPPGGPSRPGRPPGRPTSPGRGLPKPGTVTVRPGDSLWRIAADALPRHAPAARIARVWPRWYAANVRVIGADPNLIRPGQTLRPPSSEGSVR